MSSLDEPAGVRRQCDFGISRYVPDEVEPLVSVHVRLSKRARYMELARLSVYASGEKLVFRLKPDALVYVQCLVECFRLAGVLPEDFSLGWRYLEYISRARRPRFSPQTFPRGEFYGYEPTAYSPRSHHLSTG